MQQGGAQVAMNPAMGGEDAGGEEPQEQKGNSIKLMIMQDGTMTVSTEEGDAESGEGQDMPVENLDQALKAIKAIAQEILTQQSPDAAQEQAGYEQAMNE